MKDMMHIINRNAPPSFIPRGAEKLGENQSKPAHKENVHQVSNINPLEDALSENDASMGIHSQSFNTDRKDSFI
jgi:hypothetical protein